MLANVVVVFILSALLLSGCSSNPSARDETLVGIAVQYATAKIVEQSSRPNTRDTIVRIATDLKALASGEAVTLLALEEVVGGELNKLSLSPADRVLADALVSLVVAELQAKVGDGLLEPDQRVKVERILDLIISAARA